MARGCSLVMVTRGLDKVVATLLSNLLDMFNTNFDERGEISFP